MKMLQKGAALPLTLILLSGMTGLAVVAGKLAAQDDRASGNAVFQGNAFQAAEAGIVEALAALRVLGAGGWNPPDSGDWVGVQVAQLGGLFEDGSGTTEAQPFDLGNGTGFWIDRMSWGAESVRVEAVGRMLGGNARQRVSVVISVSGNPAPPQFNIVPNAPGVHAVVACNGVYNTGSGAIRSTNSLDPDYSGSDASVFTIGNDADITLSGAARIEGDVSATGAVSIPGSSIVVGDVLANDLVSITGGGSRVHGSVQTQGSVNVIGSAQVGIGPDGGGIYSGGTVDLRSSIVNGDVFAVGNLLMSQTSANIAGNANINGNVNIFASGGGTIDGLLTYGGSIVGKQNWQNLDNYARGGATNGAPMVEVPPAQESYDCDPYDAAELVADHRLSPSDRRNGNHQPSGYWDAARGAYITQHSLGDLVADPSASDHQIHVTGNFVVTNNQQVDFSPVDSTYLRIDGNFQINGGSRLNIPDNSDVVMYIGGNTSIGGNGRLNIGANSTLTIYTEGRMEVSGAGLIIQDGNPVMVDEAGEVKPRLTIYSNYDSAPNSSPWSHGTSGFRIGGDSVYYAVVYAPKTDVSIEGSGELVGAVWGQGVKVSGASRITYDVALREAFSGLGGADQLAGGIEALSFTVSSWQQQ